MAVDLVARLRVPALPLAVLPAVPRHGAVADPRAKLPGDVEGSKVREAVTNATTHLDALAAGDAAVAVVAPLGPTSVDGAVRAAALDHLAVGPRAVRAAVPRRRVGAAPLPGIYRCQCSSVQSVTQVLLLEK